MAPITTAEKATKVATAALRKAASKPPNTNAEASTSASITKAAPKGKATSAAANTSRKRKIESSADETEEEEAVPAKRQRGAPKKETTTTSKKAVAGSSKAKASSSRAKATSSKPAASSSKPPARSAKSTTKTTTKANASTTKKAAAKAQASGSNGTSKKRKNGDEDNEEERQPPVKKVRATPEKKTVVKPKKVINTAPKQKMNIYVMGEGSAGELGLGSAKGVTDVKRPRLNALLSAETVGVVQIATGGMHVLALTHDNKIVTWGVNDQGALGRDTTWSGGLKDVNADDSDSDAGSDSGLNPRESTPTAIPSDSFPENTVFVQVAAGDSISMALTDEGFVYGWGTFRNNEGILGFSATSKVQQTPALIPGLKKITSLACGDNHVLAVTDKGAVFAFGSGQQNQLGRRVVERTAMNGLIPREFGLPKNKITYVACGAYHSFAIEKNGKVWTWGLNSYGETGVNDGAGDDKAIIFKPMEVEALAGKGVTSMAGGQHHSLAATAEGECLVWGRCDGSQTGLELVQVNADSLIKDDSGKNRILMSPTPIPNIGKVVYVAAGSDHNIAIAEDGKAYSWGFSGTYQTGQGTTDDISVATHIDNTAVRGKQLVWAGAGGQFSVLASYA